jgi:hypothetical protein
MKIMVTTHPTPDPVIIQHPQRKQHEECEEREEEFDEF